jgi:hypothetical protein
MNAPRTGPSRVGRFTLLCELGRSAQATVFLAHDGAHAVSRLSHPHLVPLFEADEHLAGPASLPSAAAARRQPG